MASFRIFIPNATGKPANNLNNVGLGSLMRPDDFLPEAQHATGPNKLIGQMIAWVSPTLSAADHPRFDFDPTLDSAIEATPDPDRGLPMSRFWLILENARPVRPQDLARKPLENLADIMPTSDDDEATIAAKKLEMANATKFGGYIRTLGDGNRWTLPNPSTLPASFKYDASGKWGPVVRPQFKSIYERMTWGLNTCRSAMNSELLKHVAVDQLTDQDRESLTQYPPKPLNDQLAAAFVVEIMSLNYRLDQWIAGELGLFTPDNLWSVMTACCDLAEINRIIADVQKKIVATPKNGSTSPSGN